MLKGTKDYTKSFKYTPIINPNKDSEWFETEWFNTFGKDWEFVKSVNESHVWTLNEDTDNKNNSWYLSSGFQHINRVRCLVTLEPVKETDRNTMYFY